MASKTAFFALVASFAAFGFGYVAYTKATPAKTETAYERVMRTHTLRCGYALWPMALEMDPNTKQLHGIVKDYTDQLAAKLGLKVEWTEEVAWGQQVEALNSGRIDALCTSDGPWVYSEAGLVDYVRPAIYYLPIYVYGRADDKRFKNYQDMNAPGVTFSTIDGDISLAVALEKFPRAKRLEVPQSGDISLLVSNVMTHKADLVVCDPMTVRTVNSATGDKLTPVLPEPVAVIGGSFSVRKGETELWQMLNQGSALLQALGITDAILDRYDPHRNIFFHPAKPWQTAGG